MSSIDKANQKKKEKREAEKVFNQTVAEEVLKATSEEVLPTIRKKAEEVSRYLEEVLNKHNNNGLTATKILPLIAKRSIADIAVTSKTYTPQELAIAFNIYIEMIEKINQYTTFPPNKGTFCQMLGISRATYDGYMQDPEKIEIMRIIDDYISTTILTSAQIGELREISSMFTLKSSHGFVEATAPIVIEHKKNANIDDIRSKIELMKNKTLEANYEEK